MRYFLIALSLLFLPNIYTADTKQPRVALVTTAKVTEGYANSLQSYVGTLYYDKNSKLASESSGVVSKIFVKVLGFLSFIGASRINRCT